jgi:hypothetical protein
VKTPARLLLLLSVAACAAAQQIRVYSEFERIGPFGNIVAVDRAEAPREILSPGLARNAFASFEVAVTPRPGQRHSLFIAQNPENSVAVSLYRAVFVRHGAEWIPDALEPLGISDGGQVDEPAAQVPGQTTQVYWMDLWVDRGAPVRRTRLELQLHDGDRWIVYPLELRLLAVRAPASSGPLEALAPVEAPSADSARACLCASGGGGTDGPPTIRALIRRNARQDAAIARALDKANLPAWCQSPAPPSALGAEWYLKARDILYRAALSSESPVLH